MRLERFSFGRCECDFSSLLILNLIRWIFILDYGYLARVPVGFLWALCVLSNGWPGVPAAFIVSPSLPDRLGGLDLAVLEL